MSEFIYQFGMELGEWGGVLRMHWARYLANFLMLLLLVILFQMALFSLLFIDRTLAYVSSEMDLLLDIREGFADEDLMPVVQEVSSIPGVVSAEIVSPDEALSFVNREVVPGYRTFLEKNRLMNPFPAVFRLKVNDVQLLSTLASDLLRRYPDYFVENLESETVDGRLSADGLVQSIADEALDFSFRFAFSVQWVVEALGVFLFGATSLFLWSLLSVRKHEFSLIRLVGFHHSFYRWSFYGIGLLFAGLLLTVGYLVFFLITGVFAPFYAWQLVAFSIAALAVCELSYRMA